MPQPGSDSSPDALNNTGQIEQESAGALQHIRALAMPFQKGQMVTEADGSLLIKDVPMLAEGTWTDSAQKTPLFYTAKALESSIGNWIDKSGWSRHLGGVPRDATDKVGEAVNPHFGQFTGKDGQAHNAMLSDIRVYPFTQKQRDMQEMIRHNLISMVSIEHGGQEVFNPETRQMESASLVYTGFAFVNKGACKLCRLNETATANVPRELGWFSFSDVYPGKNLADATDAEKTHYKSLFAFVSGNGDTESDYHLPYRDPKTGEVDLPHVRNALARLNQVQGIGGHADAVRSKLENLLNKENEDNMVETKELEEQITALKKELETVKAAKQEIKVEVPKELSDQITAMAARIKALEQDGSGKTSATEPTKELEMPEYYVPVDRKKGTVGGDL